MNKKSFWDNSSLQENVKWDNQQLLGIPDSELLTKNWNLDTSHKEHSKRIKKLYKDPDYKTKWQNAVNISSQNPQVKKNHAIGNSKKLNDPKFWENYYKGIKIRDSNPEYHKKRIAASNAKIAIKILTPDGEFDSISDAARHYGLTSEGMRYRVNSSKYPDFKKIKN